MSPTLDENATTSDPRITAQAARAAFLLAVFRAIELDGAPAPRSIHFETGRVRFVMDEGAVKDVADWAHLLGVPAGHDALAFQDWRRHVAETEPSRPWHGFQLQVSCTTKTPPAGA